LAHFTSRNHSPGSSGWLWFHAFSSFSQSSSAPAPLILAACQICQSSSCFTCSSIPPMVTATSSDAQLGPYDFGSDYVHSAPWGSGSSRAKSYSKDPLEGPLGVNCGAKGATSTLWLLTISPGLPGALASSPYKGTRQIHVKYPLREDATAYSADFPRFFAHGARRRIRPRPRSFRAAAFWCAKSSENTGDLSGFRRKTYRAPTGLRV